HSPSVMKTISPLLNLDSLRNSKALSRGSSKSVPPPGKYPASSIMSSSFILQLSFTPLKSSHQHIQQVDPYPFLLLDSIEEAFPRLTFLENPFVMLCVLEMIT